ncbi:MAG: hypothetical protein IID38_09920, partial [Planctomycetes bacterium]|nr:hypothetical protein [Planctomycetota bacterium]
MPAKADLRWTLPTGEGRTELGFERVQHATPKSFFPLLPYQRADVESDARFRWSCWARQTGKSFTKSLRRIVRGLNRRRNQIFLSAGERQSRELMQKARQHCQTLQIATKMVSNNFFEGTTFKQLEIALPNGVRIIGYDNLPGHVAMHASQMYSSNLMNFIQHFWNEETKALELNTKDEIMAGALVTNDGALTSEMLQK